jgi:REP element-mobilizing transposase RayT
MPNHFHLVVETPQGNLAAGMGWLLSTYSNRFNHRHERCVQVSVLNGA